MNNGQIRKSLESLLWGILISSGYLVSNLPSYADPIAEPKPEATAKTNETIAQATINQVQLTGNTVLTPEAIASILQPLQGKAITTEQFKAAVEAITQLYISNGYLTSSAQFDPSDPQSVVNGVAQIKALEGQIERVDIVGTTQTNPDYVRSRVELGISKPFNANAVVKK